MASALLRSSLAARSLARSFSTSLALHDAAAGATAAASSSSAASPPPRAPRAPRNADGASSSSRPQRSASSARGTSRGGSSSRGASARGGGSSRGGGRPSGERADRPPRRFDGGSPSERRVVVPAKIDVPSTEWSSPLYAIKGAAYLPAGPPVPAEVALGADGKPASPKPLRKAERSLHVHLRKGVTTLGPVKANEARALPEVERVAREEKVLAALGGQVLRKAEQEAKGGEGVLKSAADVLEQNVTVGPEGRVWVVKQMRELMK
jgi:hypothetical protein